MSLQVTWTHPRLNKILGEITIDAESICDLGCGRGIIGALIRIYRNPKKLVGVEIFKPYLDFCSKHSLYDELLCHDLNELPLPFKDNEFDIVTAIEVIEHLPKKNGELLILEMERIAKRKIIITTPNIFFKQIPYDNNIFQLHRSRWSYRDFNRNFRVHGIGGFIVLGVPIPILSHLLANFSWILPCFSTSILITKDIK